MAKQCAPEYDCEAIYRCLKDEEDSFKAEIGNKI